MPEVAVENVGLHIGGGPNDDASKAPFRNAIAARFADFRRCYTKVSQPGKGGTCRCMETAMPELIIFWMQWSI